MENGRTLIFAGALLWLTNVLLFGLWYWELDSGGPMERMRKRHRHPDFLFVQMSDPRWAPKDWHPGLGRLPVRVVHQRDRVQPYRHDAADRHAKWLMSAQAVTALVTVALVVSRAVNILS